MEELKIAPQKENEEKRTHDRERARLALMEDEELMMMLMAE